MEKTRQKQRKSKIKITEWHRKPGAKPGYIIIKNKDLKHHEEATIQHLASFGHNIEVLAPSNMPGTNNPDLLMMGTFWEMKASWSKKKRTLDSKFRKAVKQSGGKAVFDLRNIRKNADLIEAEKTIMQLFKETRGMRRIIIIKKDGTTLDFMK